MKNDANVFAGGRQGLMRKANQTIAAFRTGHTVSIRGKLLCDGTMTDDDTGDGRCVVRAHKNTTWCEGGNESGGDIGQRRDAVGGEAKKPTPSGR